ncbi:Hypothetical predicted protein [Paramuricea clavata]|uniref:Uncharacterized protein n=1 Tax=Paramuricea clavata TaxID=317549 RepID=A0A6S7G527_PARCT|nr:Hypothetical predicted protein [Paramuricea clavata]
MSHIFFSYARVLHALSQIPYAAAIVTDVSSTYKEKIIDAVIQKEWNIIFHLSTKRDVNCEAKIDSKIALYFKKTDDGQCTNLANATIVSKLGACEATMFNQTSRNIAIGLKYYVKFPPIDPFDFKQENGDEVNSQTQTFLLTQVTMYLILFHFPNILAPSIEENTTHT